MVRKLIFASEEGKFTGWVSTALSDCVTRCVGRVSQGLSVGLNSSGQCGNWLRSDQTRWERNQFPHCPLEFNPTERPWETRPTQRVTQSERAVETHPVNFPSSEAKMSFLTIRGEGYHFQSPTVPSHLHHSGPYIWQGN